MKLNPKEFKRFKELSASAKAGKISDAEKEELAGLAAKKNEKGSNDVSWYLNYPELAKGATNVPFNHIPGTSLGLVNPNQQSRDVNFPGVARVRYVPAIGKSVSPSDAFNAQMRQLWLDMHRKYRGMGGYQRADLGITILAIIELFATLSKCERIYGAINTYKVMNRNVPYSLYEALCIDKDVETSLADFRYNLNVRIEKMKQLCLPKGIAALTERLLLNSFIYKDAEDARASLFLFDPETFGVYSATGLSTGGCVIYYTYDSRFNGTTPGGSVGATAANLLAILDMQLNALIDDDDIAKMCSDIIAAYGPENVASVGYIPEDWRVEPVHDYERKLQFHNATINGEVTGRFLTSVIDASTANTLYSNGMRNVIYQSNDVVRCEFSRSDVVSAPAYIDEGFGSLYTIAGNPSANYAWGVTDKAILDVFTDNPSETEVLCGTRFTSICGPVIAYVDSSSNTRYAQEFTSFGTEIITYIDMYTRDSQGTFTIDTVYGSVIQDSVFASGYTQLIPLLQFDWHPILYIFISGTGNLVTFGDLDNFTGLTNEMLSRLHETAVYSEFKIPNVSYIQ